VSDPFAERGVAGHQQDECHAERQEKEVEHCRAARFVEEASITPGFHKGAI